MPTVPQWDDQTTVTDSTSWRARGFRDGAEEGYIYGGQTLGWWQLIAHYAHHNPDYREGFLFGVVQGVQRRIAERHPSVSASVSTGGPMPRSSARRGSAP